MKYINFLIMLLTCGGVALIYKTFIAKKSTIVILNGPSASGKSSIQEAFIRMSDTPWIKIGIDNFFVGVLSNYYIFGQYQPTDPKNLVMQGVPGQDQEGNPLFTLKIGPGGEKIIDGMNHAIKAYADAGNNIIVDYIAYEPVWLENLVTILKNHKVLVIGINLPLEVLEQREANRATSPKGHARSHYQTVHNHQVNYDLSINSSEISPQTAAEIIKDLLKKY